MINYYKDNTEHQKFCPRCKVLLPRSDFYVETRRKDGVSPYCKKCKNKISTEWAKKNGYDHRSNQIKSVYGVDRDTINKMIENQNNKCGICSCVLDKSFHIDHDHETGKIRGILCRYCNMGLGFFRDSIDNLKSAITYLM